MKDIENLKPISEEMRKHIWERDERLCKKCRQVVYRTFIPKGLVHHIDFDRRNNQEYNLLLLCSRYHRSLHNLYMRDIESYGWMIELATKTKCTMPYGRLSNGYRYSHALIRITQLERENNILTLPRKDLELLEYPKNLEKRLLTKHNKAESKLMSKAKEGEKEEGEGDNE